MGSPDKVAGFALGALLDGDRAASQVRSQVDAAFQAAVVARLLEIPAAADKREALATLIRCVRPEPTSFAGARRGQAIDPELLAVLKRLATRLPPAIP